MGSKNILTKLLDDREGNNAMTDVEKLLDEGNIIQIKPQGTSMWPLFSSGNEQAIVAPVDRALKSGDVVLYRRKESILVIHRICRCDKKGYYLVGDNQTEIEGPIKESQIKGVMVAFIRKGKTVSVNNVLYRLYSFVWLKSRRVRAVYRKIKWR